MSLPKFPEKIEGSFFFREIIPEIQTEYDPFKLATLGVIIEKKGRTAIYESLWFGFRKVQWVKLIGIKAMHLEDALVNEAEPNCILFDPLTQSAHSLCVTDFLIYTKSALDSMAVFLNELLELGQRGGDRDFKKAKFRQLVYQKDAYLKRRIKKLEPWFLELQGVRDEWIHNKTIESLSVYGKSDVGMLPIPKVISLSSEDQAKLSVDTTNFYSTKSFVDHHYSNLSKLFRLLVDRGLQIERLGMVEQVNVSELFKHNLTIFPFHLTERTTIKKMKSRNPRPLVDW